MLSKLASPSWTHGYYTSFAKPWHNIRHTGKVVQEWISREKQ